MSETETMNDSQTENKTGEKKTRRRKAAKKPTATSRKPKLKDWIRVQKSTGNGLPNIFVQLRINEATNVVELFTVAPKSEGSNEQEESRCQVFTITGFEVINDANYTPLATDEEESNDSKSEQTESKTD